MGFSLKKDHMVLDGAQIEILADPYHYLTSEVFFFSFSWQAEQLQHLKGFLIYFILGFYSCLTAVA